MAKTKDVIGEKMTKEQRDRVIEAQRHWYIKGDVAAWRDLSRALANDEMPDAALLNLTAVRPQTDVDMGEVEIPPRDGKGSGVGAWREFAKAVSDMDPEVIDESPKAEIIANLEAAGVIPAEVEEE